MSQKIEIVCPFDWSNCGKEQCGWWASDMDWSENPPTDKGCCAIVEIARNLRSVTVRIYGTE